MQTKLTLRLDDKLIADAKKHATQQGKSLSMIVADYFRSLQRNESRVEGSVSTPPITRSLHGLLKSSGLDEAGYRCHLEEKHR